MSMNIYRVASVVSDLYLTRVCNMLLCPFKTRHVCHISTGVPSLLARTHVTDVTAPRRKTPGLDSDRKTPGLDSDRETKSHLRAIDLARKIQREKVKANPTVPDEAVQTPLQRRVAELRQFTQQLQHVHPNVLAKHLHRGLLLHNTHLAVINKPYGVSVQDGSGGKNNISSILPILAKMMDGMQTESQLHVCLGLDKETTGALLLARSEEAADYIQNLHKNHQVERRYWVVTVGVPVPSEGVIDIPVIERAVTGPQPHFKMSLSPVYRVSDDGEGMTRVRAHRQATGATTKYRVLDSSHGCSLVELQPVTGVKHQMRVHMAYGLACPILGDHKYSHWNKLAPQQLPESVLRRLGLEQSKARYLPLHLHARQLTIPGLEGQRDITISCPLPKFFTSTTHRMQITLPNRKETS